MHCREFLKSYHIHKATSLKKEAKRSMSHSQKDINVEYITVKFSSNIVHAIPEELLYSQSIITQRHLTMI